MSRNILNNNDATNRNIINRKIRSFANTATLPLEITDVTSTSSTIGLKGLSGFTANKVVKVNNAGDALEYATETDTIYTAGNVLQLVGTEFSVLQSNFATVNNDFAEADFMPYFKSDGVTFRKISRLALLENINYLAASPIVKNNSTFTYELDFSNLTANGDTITDASEFIISTDAAKTIRSLTYLNLKNDIISNFTITTTPPISVNSNELISLNMSSLAFGTGFNGNDEFLYSLPGGSSWKRVTFSTLSSSISSQSAVNVNDFGTGFQTGTRTLGSAAYDLVIQGNNPIVVRTVNASNNCVLKLNNVNCSVSNGSDRAIAGFFSLSGVNRCYLGNATDDSELFSNLTFAKKLNAAFGDGRFLFGDSNARMRIASSLNSVNAVIEIFTEGTGGTPHGAFIFGDISNDLNLTTQNAARFTVILNQLKPTNSLHLTNLSDSGTIAVKSYYSSSTTSTSTHAWRNQIGGSGNYHWDYATNTAGSGNWAIKGYIDPTVTGVPRMNFTGQHRCIPETEDLYSDVSSYIGMVVEATGQYNSIDFTSGEEETVLEDKIEGHFDVVSGVWVDEVVTRTPTVKRTASIITTDEPSINESQPVVRLTTAAKSKRVYGVISSGEDGENRTYSSGCFVSDLGKRDDNRLFINSLGEGGILVCSEGGNIENGDYICSSSIAGIAMKQDDDILHNYTIAKSTMDYVFVDGAERKLIGCTYHCG
jgi:hypothetical protein